MPVPFAGFEIGKRYDLHSQMWPASPGYGTYFAGIATKGRFPETEGIILLATLGEDTRYQNHWDKDVLVLSGEDRISTPDAKSIDQDPEAGRNRTLTHANESGIPVYCFCKDEDAPTWEYLGLVDVDGHSMVPQKGRLVVEYRLVPTGAGSLESYRELESKVNLEVESSEEDPPLTEPGAHQRVPGQRAMRSRSFSKAVKDAYGNKCAICGIARVDAAGNFEVAAAHIYPVELQGADKVRNGLALCQLHHWAFDGALCAIGTDLKVEVMPKGNGVPGVEEYRGSDLPVLPSDPKKRPHTKYLEARLSLSRQGWTAGSRNRKTKTISRPPDR